MLDILKQPTKSLEKWPLFHNWAEIFVLLLRYFSNKSSSKMSKKWDKILRYTIKKMAQKTSYDKHVENSTMWSILKIIWQDPLGLPKKYDKIYEQPRTKMNYMYRNYQYKHNYIGISIISLVNGIYTRGLACHHYLLLSSK